MSRLHDEEFNDRLEVQAFVELERQRAENAAQAERISELEDAISMYDSACAYDGNRIASLSLELDSICDNLGGNIKDIQRLRQIASALRSGGRSRSDAARRAMLSDCADTDTL